MSRLRSSTLAALMLLSACVMTTLSPAGERVRLTSNPDVVAECDFLGEVTGSDGFNGGIAGQRAAEENAIRRLKNAAGALGADVVFLVSSETGMSGSTQRGEAYRCRPRASGRR